MKAFVIGLDGATYNILGPLLEEGRLPNLARLIEDGVSGTLDSTIPPATYPAWKCYSTGCHPTKLGFHSFLSFREGELEPASTDSPEIWDYVSDDGGTAVSINMPTTYPAKTINGLMTSGYVIGGDDWVAPNQVRPVIQSEFNYRPEVSFPVHTELLGDDTEESRAEIRSIMQSRFDLAKFTIDELDPDFLQMTLYYTDTYQHFFWNDKEILYGMWEYVDEQIGELLDRLDDDTYVFVVSDHGFEELESGIFYVNRWLEMQGYLSLESDVTTGLFGNLSIDTQTLKKALDTFGLLPLTRAIIPERYRRKVPNPRGEIGVDQLSERIEWEDSTAVMYGGGIFLNSDRLGKKYESVRDKLIKQFEGITSPETDETILVGAYRPEEIYEPGPEVPRDNDEVPDILLLPKDNAFVSPGYASDIWNTTDLAGRWSVHAKKGVFIAKGPGIRQSESVDIDIFNVAPTILHAMEVPIEKNVDGTVEREIFEDNSRPATTEPRYQGERERISRAVRKGSIEK